MDKKQLRKILSRSFGTIPRDTITGEKKPVMINGKGVVSGYHFLADFEVEGLIDEIIKGRRT